MTSQHKCIWQNPEVCNKGILKECNHCGEVLCTYHYDSQAHVVYSCSCKICEKRVIDGCTHGVPEWSKSNVI